MQDKIDKRRLPNIQVDGVSLSFSYNGGKMPLEQVLENTDKSIFLIADGGVGKSTSLRALWLGQFVPSPKNNRKQGNEKRRSYIYVDLKLLDSSVEDNAIYDFVSRRYNINLSNCKLGDTEELILLLDSANEANESLKKVEADGKCKLVKNIEKALEDFRVVISSRSSEITLKTRADGVSGRNEPDFSNDKVTYCKLCLLGDEVVKREFPDIDPGSALYKLLQNNMMLMLYRDVKKFIYIDQDKITAGKLLDLYFEICFKTRFVKNGCAKDRDVATLSEKSLYDEINKVEEEKRQNPDRRFQEDKEEKIAQALKGYWLVYNYLVNNANQSKFDKYQIMENNIRLAELEHLSILQKGADNTYVWGNEIYQQYFRAKKCANAIKDILENNDKGVQNLSCAETIKSFFCYHEGDYEIVQYAGEILDVSPDNINQLFKYREKYNDNHHNNYERFVVIMSALTGNGLPEGLETICRGLFSGCNSLAEIIMPNSVTKIEWAAFSGCKNLKNVSISNSVTVIESFAFGNCLSLTDIIIPNSVTKIEWSAFAGCKNLKNVTIKDGGKMAIMSCAFEDCGNLSSIQLGDSVVSMGLYVFSNCNSLESINIPATVTSIGKSDYKNDDFEGGLGSCSSLISITVDDRNTIYHSEGNCIIETATKTLIVGCKNSTIPNDGSVSRIRRCAFNSWYSDNMMNGPTNITIPNSITSIDEDALLGCVNCESINVSSDHKKYRSAGNCLIETESKTLILGCKNSIIPNDGSVVSISDYAFSYCTELTQISIPDSVTAIGCSAFA